MPATNLIITNMGSAALINAAANGTNAVTIVSCGLSQTHANYNNATNALIGQFKIINNISGGAIDPATINLAFADQSADAYDLHAIALYLSDGTLFAIYSQPTPIFTKTAGTDGVLSVNIKLLNNSSLQINFGNTNLFNPPSSETAIGVIEIATQTETNTGTDDLRAITPKKLTAFWNSKSAWTINNDGAGSGLDADLLDGQHGAYFLDLANATGTLPTARLSGTYNISISGNAATADNATNAANATNSSKLGNILAANYWHTGNDGAGSGLDADLLDGQSGAYFLDLANATNTLPSARLNGNYNISISGNAASADNATNAANATNSSKLGNILATNYWHSGNDGAGSGLDADLLGGKPSAGYLSNSASSFNFRSSADNGYISLAQGNASNAGYIVFNSANHATMGYIGLADTGNIFLYAEISQKYSFNRTPYVLASPVWHAGNDGAGSGLDADLLDGQSGAYFLDLANVTGTLPTARLNGNYNISISGNAATADNATNATNSNKLGNAPAADYYHVNNSRAAHASVNFNGQTMVINNAFGVSSITDLGTGQYRINFLTPLTDANAPAAIGVAIGTTSYSGAEFELGGAAIMARTPNYIEIRTSNDTEGDADNFNISVIVMRP